MERGPDVRCCKVKSSFMFLRLFLFHAAGQRELIRSDLDRDATKRSTSHCQIRSISFLASRAAIQPPQAHAVRPADASSPAPFDSFSRLFELRSYSRSPTATRDILDTTCTSSPANETILIITTESFWGGAPDPKPFWSGEWV